MISIANPETIQGLVDMALMVKHPKQKSELVALSVINDNNTSEAKEIKAKRSLERTSMIAAASDTPVRTVLRYDLNIAQGIIHTARENEITDLIIGLHRKTNLLDSFFGSMTESLLGYTHLQIMIAKLLIPVNTLRRIVVAIPAQAEFEAGFLKWVIQICRLSRILGCRAHFYGTEQTLAYLRRIVEREEASTATVYSKLEDWDDLLLLTGQVSYDHLFVVVSARKGSISYQPSFEKLPSQITRYFSNNSLLMIYPDQWGDQQESMTFSDPRRAAASSTYDNAIGQLYKWFKKE